MWWLKLLESGIKAGEDAQKARGKMTDIWKDNINSSGEGETNLSNVSGSEGGDDGNAFGDVDNLLKLFQQGDKNKKSGGTKSSGSSNPYGLSLGSTDLGL